MVFGEDRRLLGDQVVALFIVRGIPGEYAVFDDLELGFTQTGLLFAEAVAKVMAGRSCHAGEAMEAVRRCAEGMAVPVAEPRAGDSLMTLDALLWAVKLICGEGVMHSGLALLGLGGHRPGPLEERQHWALAELCDAFGVDPISVGLACSSVHRTRDWNRDVQGDGIALDRLRRRRSARRRKMPRDGVEQPNLLELSAYLG
jgi:hypothetical protein